MKRHTRAKACCKHKTWSQDHQSGRYVIAVYLQTKEEGVYVGVGGEGWNKRGAHVMSSVEKLDTMLLMKFSRMMTARIAFQSVAFSPRSRQIDSKATFTIAGGLPIDRTSTKCCFFIDFTAV